MTQTLTVPTIEQVDAEIKVLAQVGQCVISDAQGYAKAWGITHTLSGHSIVIVPKGVTDKLADIKRLVQMLTAVDLDAYWNEGRKDRGCNKRVLNIFNEWGKEFSYRMTLPKFYSCDIRLAVESDVAECKAVARAYSKELGYVMWPALRESVEGGTLLVAVDEHGVVGFCNYHKRRDGWQTVYEVAVHKDLKGRQIGRRLIDFVPLPIRLKCPEDGAANGFYKRLGFRLVRVEEGRRRRLNVWERGSL